MINIKHKILISIFSIILLGPFSLNTTFAQDDVGGGESLGGIPAMHVSLHKENYVLPFYRSVPNPRDTNQSNELKFQVSVKFTPFSWGNWNYVIAFTQKAFWQIYSADTSRPFREANYNPETFFRWKPSHFYTDFGYEHESNGESDPKSRSWDRIYVRLGVLAPSFKFSFKYWYVFADEFFGPDYEERNLAAEDYYGSFEVDFGLQMGEVILKGMGRLNYETERGYGQGMLLWRFYGSMLFGFTYSRGFGDSMRSYNINHEAYGVGFLLNP